MATKKTKKTKRAPMRQWRITNMLSGADLGVYRATTEARALDAMARDAGYKNYKELDEVAPAQPGEIRVADITRLT